MMNSPRDLWTPEEVLARRINTGLADAIPNILVGTGLLFTFLFLAWALVGSTSTLMTSGATSRETEVAIQNLLTVAGAKFLTSLVGLGSSLIWFFCAKKWLYQIQNASDDFLTALAHHVNPQGVELITQHQLEQSDDKLGYVDELLSELREQSGVLKRFETDFVVAMKGQTDRMIQSIETLAKSLTAISADALQGMMQEFVALLKRMTEEEFAHFNDVLREVTQSLQVSATSLNDGATQLCGAAGVIKDGVYEFEECLESATERGARGIELADQWLTRVDDSHKSLVTSSSAFNEAATQISSVSGNLAGVTQRMDELSREQLAVVEAVRTLAPQATEAAERLGQVMGDAVRSTKSGMETTAKTLGAVVHEVTQGITDYSVQVVKLHESMDAQMANAITNFDKGVNQLSGQVDALRDFSIRQVSDASLAKLVVTMERLIELRTRKA